MAKSFLKIEVDSKKLDAALKRAPKKTKRLIQEGLKEAALDVQSDSKKNAPWDTGNLRRSITHEIKAMSAKIGTDVVYAAIQEYGGEIRPVKGKYLTFKINGHWVRTTLSRIPPYKGKGYLRPALQSNEKNINQIFSKKFKNILV